MYEGENGSNEGKYRQRDCMKEGKKRECMRVKRDRMKGESRQRDCKKEGT